jgi:hypothetical protein
LVQGCCQCVRRVRHAHVHVNCLVVVNVAAMFGNSCELAWNAQCFSCKAMATIPVSPPPPNHISTDQQFAIFPVRTRDLGKSRPDVGQGVICLVDVVFLIAGTQDEPWRYRCCAAVCAVPCREWLWRLGMWLRPKCDVADVGGRWCCAQGSSVRPVRSRPSTTAGWRLAREIGHRVRGPLGVRKRHPVCLCGIRYLLGIVFICDCPQL